MQAYSLVPAVESKLLFCMGREGRALRGYEHILVLGGRQLETHWDELPRKNKKPLKSHFYVSFPVQGPREFMWTHPSGAEVEQVCDNSAAEQIIFWLTDIMVMRNFWRFNVYLYQLANLPPQKPWQWNGSVRPLDSPFKLNVKKKKWAWSFAAVWQLSFWSKQNIV